MNKLVVIVEDDADILDLIQFIIADAGFDVVGFNHLVSVEDIMGQSPTVVLLDIRLQDGDGDTLCNLIKSNPSSRHIPVVLISALSNLEGIAHRCQADGFLAKPFDVADLVSIVERYA